MRIDTVTRSYPLPSSPARPTHAPDREFGNNPGGVTPANAEPGGTPRERRVDRVVQGELLSRSHPGSRQTDYGQLAHGARNANSGTQSAHTAGLSPAQRAVATYQQVQSDALGLEHRRIDLLV